MLKLFQTARKVSCVTKLISLSLLLAEPFTALYERKVTPPLFGGHRATDFALDMEEQCPPGSIKVAGIPCEVCYGGHARKCQVVILCATSATVRERATSLQRHRQLGNHLGFVTMVSYYLWELRKRSNCRRRQAVRQIRAAVSYVPASPLRRQIRTTSSGQGYVLLLHTHC